MDSLDEERIVAIMLANAKPVKNDYDMKMNNIQEIAAKLLGAKRVDIDFSNNCIVVWFDDERVHTHSYFMDDLEKFSRAMNMKLFGG